MEIGPTHVTESAVLIQTVNDVAMRVAHVDVSCFCDQLLETHEQTSDREITPSFDGVHDQLMDQLNQTHIRNML